MNPAWRHDLATAEGFCRSESPGIGDFAAFRLIEMTKSQIGMEFCHNRGILRMFLPQDIAVARPGIQAVSAMHGMHWQ